MRTASSLRARLALAMGVLLSLVLLLTILSVTMLARVDRSTSTAITTLVTTGQLTNALAAGITNQVRVADRLQVDPSPTLERRLEALSDSTHLIQGELRQIPDMTPADHARLNLIASMQARIEVTYVAAHVLRTLGQPGAADQQVAALRPVADSLLDEVEAISSAQSARALSRAGQLREEAERRRRVLWFLVFSATAIGVVSAFFTIRAVDGPLARLVAATQRFGAGDLRPVDLRNMPAELAALGSAMNTMGARIRQILVTVQQEAREIEASAGDFSAMSQELAATSGQVSEAMVHLAEAADGQVRALREADAQLEQLRKQAGGSLLAAQRVTSVGTTITTMAGDHELHVRAASATLLAVRETVMASAAEVRQALRMVEQLEGLVDRDRQLGAKVGVLAVNASIEAARAGVHGQGLGAVAEELRRLGEMCEAAVEEGERAVRTLQQQVQATASTLEKGSITVLGVEATADRAASALTEIARGIAAMNRAADQVVHDAGEARGGMTAMLERTGAATKAAVDHAQTGESVSAAAEEQAAATEEMAAAAARLSEAAQRLNDVMRDFRT